VSSTDTRAADENSTVSCPGTRSVEETQRCLVLASGLLTNSALSSTGTRAVDETPRYLVLVPGLLTKLRDV
jgi:hypothetical protein